LGEGLLAADGEGDGLALVPPKVQPASATTRATAPSAGDARIADRL
jgi:hypothetical protein